MEMFRKLLCRMGLFMAVARAILKTLGGGPKRPDVTREEGEEAEVEAWAYSGGGVEGGGVDDWRMVMVLMKTSTTMWATWGSWGRSAAVVFPRGLVG